MNCFDGLKDAWVNRKKEIEARMNALSSQGLFGGGGYGAGYGYGNQYGQAQEYSRLEQVSCEINSQWCLVSITISWRSRWIRM